MPFIMSLASSFSAVVRKQLNMMMALRMLSVGILFAVITSSAYSEELKSSEKIGEYEIFYSAFNTSFISPEVASAAGITRGKNKGLVNVSIVRYDEGRRIPVEAESIIGESYDLIYRKALEFKAIVEPGARYYLAPFKISDDNEFIQFHITVLPKGLDQAIDITFKRRFFQD